MIEELYSMSFNCHFFININYSIKLMHCLGLSVFGICQMLGCVGISQFSLIFLHGFRSLPIEHPCIKADRQKYTKPFALQPLMMIHLNMTFSSLPNNILGIVTGPKQDTDTINIITLIEHQPLSSDPVYNSHFLSLMWVNLFVGLFYRILVFKRIWKTGGLFGGRPINILTGIFEMQYFYFILIHFQMVKIYMCHILPLNQQDWTKQ